MKQDNSLQNNLRSTRLRQGVSQQHLAEVAGVTRQTISGIESGLFSPSAAVALRLAKAFGCPVEELFWLAEDLPTLDAVPASPYPAEREQRVTLAQIGGWWVAHSLEGERAYQLEMVPADGIAEWDPARENLSVKLLDDPESMRRTVVLAGCAPALSLWARSAERWHPGLRVHWIHANSMDALRGLARGEFHAAGLHLYDPETGEYNAPYVRQVMKGRSVSLINLGVWEEGLVVQPGNPKELLRAADLAQTGVRIVNREEGAGSRLLLDTLLEEAAITPSSLSGYDHIVESHQQVALAVLRKQADAGVSAASVAATFGLDFVPLHKVRYDLAFPKEFLYDEPVRQLLSTLHHRWVRAQFELLGGYSTQQTGEVVAEV